MGFKFYINDTKFSDRNPENSYLLIIDDSKEDRHGDFSGCLIRSSKDRLGYQSGWRREFFKELDEDVDLDIDNRNFINGKLLVEQSGNQLHDCVVDFENQTLSIQAKDTQDIRKKLKLKNEIKIKLKKK